MLSAKKNKATKFFFKFIITNCTIFMMFLYGEYIIKYMYTDFDYEIIGPYMARSTVGLKKLECEQFYEQDQEFITHFFQIMTRSQYMKMIKSLTKEHGQGQQILFTIMSMAFSFIIQIIAFIYTNELLSNLDLTLNLLLPHFTLMMNAINWGDICIIHSPILNILQYSVLSYTGQFTFGTVCILVIVYGLMEAIGLMKIWWCSLIFSAFVCLEISWILILNLAILMNSSQISGFIFLTKTILLSISPYL